MRIILTLMLISSTGILLAAETKKISLNEAVSIAFSNNHDYKIAVKKQKIAEEKINETWGQLYPVLESEASLTRQYAENGFQSLSDGMYDIRLVQLRIGVNPGFFLNSLSISRNIYKSAVEESRKIKSEIEYNVIKSYFALIISSEMIKLRTETSKVLNENLKDVNNLYKTGSVPRYELLQAEVRLQSNEPLLLEAESDYKIALAVFNFNLGFDKNEYEADQSYMNPETISLSSENQQKEISRLTALALKSRPEMVQLNLKKSISKDSRDLNSSIYLWPTFSVAGSYGLTSNMPNSINITMGPVKPDFTQITGTSDWQKTWQVRFAATYRWGALVPIDQSRSRVSQDDIAISQANEELLKLKNQISISITSSYLGLVTSLQTIVSHKKNVENALEGLRIAKESYRAGIIKNSELLSAQLVYTEARTGLIYSVNKYYISLAELKKETGVNDEKTIFEKK